jgi:hypothetical protein
MRVSKMRFRKAIVTKIAKRVRSRIKATSRKPTEKFEGDEYKSRKKLRGGKMTG